MGPQKDEVEDPHEVEGEMCGGHTWTASSKTCCPCCRLSTSRQSRCNPHGSRRPSATCATNPTPTRPRFTSRSSAGPRTSSLPPCTPSTQSGSGRWRPCRSFSSPLIRLIYHCLVFCCLFYRQS